MKTLSDINPLSFRMESLLIPISIGIPFFFSFYFNPDKFLGSLNNTFFKPKMYKNTPNMLKIKSI